MDRSALTWEKMQDGTLAVKTTETLMVLTQSRYKELLHFEELLKDKHLDIDEKQLILEQERKSLKKQNTKLEADIQKLTQQNAVLQKKLTEYNCVVDELKELRRQNTDLLIELSKYTALS